MKLEEEAKAGVYWAQRLRCFLSRGACTLRTRSQKRVLLDGMEWTAIGEPC